MESKRPIKLNLAEKLKNKAYRIAFFRARAQDDTASNIRELRENRNLSQTVRGFYCLLVCVKYILASSRIEP